MSPVKKEPKSNPTSEFHTIDPISRLKEYCDNGHVDKPKYEFEEVNEQKFKCKVTFQGKSYEATLKGGKQDAKRGKSLTLSKSVVHVFRTIVQYIKHFCQV